MQLRESVFFGEIGVPESNDLENSEFSSEIATDPSVSEVHKVNF